MDLNKIARQLGRHRKSSRAIALLLIATFAGAGLNLGTQVFLARILGVGQFGYFSAALAFVSLLAPISGFGIAGFWLNAFGREGWEACRWMPGSIRFLAFSMVAVLSLLFIWAWLGPHDPAMRWMLSILAATVLGQTALELAGAKFQLEGRHSKLAAWQFTQPFLRFIGVLLLFGFVGKKGFCAEHAAWAYVAAALLILIIGGCQIALMLRGKLMLEGHGPAPGSMSFLGQNQPSAGAVASAAWPFGLAGFFYLIYFQIDLILINYIVNEAAVGVYSAAFLIMSAIYLFPGVVYQKFLLPRLNRWAHHDIAKLQTAYRMGNLIMLLSGVTAMIMLWLLAPFLLTLLFGRDYQGAVTLILILALAVPFRFLASSAGAMLVTGNHMRLKVRLMGCAAVLNIFLNLIFIYLYGVIGAAASTVFTEMFVMIMYIVASKKLVFH